MPPNSPVKNPKPRQQLLSAMQRMCDLHSLRWRLTVEIAIALVLALGIVTVWNSWQMQRILITTHTQNIAQIANRFPHDVEIYREMLPIETSIQKAINNVINPQLLLWVRDTDGKLVAHSSNFQPELPTNQELITFASMPHQPEIYRLADSRVNGMSERYVVLCEGNIVIKGNKIGTVYLAQDVTADRQQLITTIFLSIGVCLLVLLLVLLAIGWRIRHSLISLNQMNTMIGSLDLTRLPGVQLQLRNPPSEVQALAQTFNMILAELSESWEHQRQLVSNVSHELRTPLTIVLGYLQSLLRRSNNLTEYQQEALTTAASETERTVRLLQDLLDLARADSGYLHFYLEPLILDDLIVEVAAIARQVSNRNITVNADRMVRATADRDRLKQVLINLINNAIKYSPDDQTIVLNVFYQDRIPTMEVCDRGIGIPLQDHYRVFERFYRVDEARSRSTGGHGLGLAISKALVEGMGGKLTLKSQLQEGSTFSITLPLAP
jgi:signal transduction histidine kinase